eukprot:TRINITY_DN7487_c0_g1_i1.p2 TRINITY_DN7487_c0_g1~~TRINITY_DN7487_c0_g1_i1.p2  ORF type:complete len:181 (+),score=35.24 TRINITY_DN7487_c0_g1_i1:88-630(+)
MSNSKTEIKHKICANCKKGPPTGTKLKVCSGCSEVAYCSRECQRAHWSEHKLVCKRKEKKGEGITVEWDDQKRINKFGRLHNHWQELEDDVKAKTHEIENLKDASDSLEGCLEDTISMKVGEMFVECPSGTVEKSVKKQLDVAQKEKDSLQAQKDSIKEDMEKLKSTLYGKFGNQINLDL